MEGRNRLEAIADLVRGYIALDGTSQYCEKTGVKEVDFRPILPEEFEGSVFAIDGSNTLIFDLAAAKLNYIRAGYVVYRGTEWQRTEIVDKVFLADQERYARQFEADLKDVFGLEEPFRLEETELDRLSTYFRELQEYAALFEAVSKADEGDLVLYDGGFAFWKEKPYGEVLERIFRLAERREIDLLGISKSSTFSWNNGFTRPFVQDTNYVGSRILPDAPWHLDLEGKNVNPCPDPSKRGEGSWGGRIYVAKFHPRSGRAFRVDAPGHVVDCIGRALSHAAMYSSSAECLGYPHALFRAHREIRITEMETRLLRRSLMNELGKRGVGEEQLRNTLDYHGVLEMQLGRML